MEEPNSRVGWVLAGSGAALFAGLTFYLTSLRWFGTHFLHFDRAITRIQCPALAVGRIAGWHW